MKPINLDQLLNVLQSNPDTGLDTCCRLIGLEPDLLRRRRKVNSQLDAIVKAALARRKGGP